MPAALRAAPEAVVAATRRLLAAIGLLLAAAAGAGVLPEDRVDAMYHYYDGGGVQIDGPSILARKSLGQHFSVYGNYYVDTVSSASIDVLSTASPYEEERVETSGGVDYLHGDTLMSLALTRSDEDDYQAQTVNLGVAQEVFGGLTTISMGYGYGDDEVRRNGDPGFREEVKRQAYRLGISQILTRSFLASLNYELITDEGYLNNPYRSVRYRDPASGSGYSYQPEVYPRTRTSNAVALRGRYYLPWRAALHAGYRYFTDDWEIDAHTLELGYTQPLGGLDVDLQYRYYTQTAADFYSDLFPYRNAQNFLARDKELSSFQSHTLRLGLSYDFLRNGWTFLERGSINLIYDRIMFDYADFRDLRSSAPVGEEPLYAFDANVIQLFFSLWF